MKDYRAWNHGPGGIKCQCCNPYGKKETKAKVNRLYRRKQKQLLHKED